MMVRGLLLIFLVGFTASVGSAQAKLTKLEQQIRRLDADAAKAILDKNEAAIDRLFAKDAVTNNPRGGLTVGSYGIKELLRNGTIDYAFFERNMESVQIRGTTAVVMGNEAYAMKGKNGKNGPTIHRRYTNIWMKNKGSWQIVARHASIICP
jgi:ketosteroid isomerase-like protein